MLKTLFTPSITPLVVLILLGGTCCAAEATLSTLLTQATPSAQASPPSTQAIPAPQTVANTAAIVYPDEDGSKLWLRAPRINDVHLLTDYKASLRQIVVFSPSPTLRVAQDELIQTISALTGQQLTASKQVSAGSIVVGTPKAPQLAQFAPSLKGLAKDGYSIEQRKIKGRTALVVLGNTELGALYGCYALLRHLQSHQPLAAVALKSAPKINRRLLNHWDNLDGSVERGYAGTSLWKWDELPATLSPRYKEYARANASIGINGTVLNNVNANAQILTAPYLHKVKALADIFRPYGIRVYLTARFSAPMEIGTLPTADPLDKNVQRWWRDKVKEIYQVIPDFGGFLVKANSEGQPGPQDYQRNHADGANMLAEALAPYQGIVMWRAFVYSSNNDDRIRKAYAEFQPLDGQFKPRVFVQAKNGPLDFQPVEPFHPLFGAMPKTPLALELQITKEYLGQDTHLAYLGPLFEETLRSDTFAKGKGSTVAKVVDGSLYQHKDSVIAGVANIGSDVNWTGSHFNQANWYVFGRMAWDPDLSSKPIAEEWVRQTFSNDAPLVNSIVDMLMASHPTLVNYMTPLGLTHIMANDHHYGPAPWSNSLSRPEWNPVFYHKADKAALGYDRTSSGSNAVAQYAEPVRAQLANRSSVPDDLLLFFHRVGWTEKLPGSGRTLWEELVYRSSLGVDQVGRMRQAWSKHTGQIDAKRFNEIADFLTIQHYEARWWRDASLSYFASVNQLSWPNFAAPTSRDLNYYQSLNCPTDVTKPRCPQVYSGSSSPALTQ